jgi:AcrR family transcriptional regulator
MKSKNEVVTEYRRAEIVAAARTVFARSGFAAGNMDAIAREAGIAKGTIYLYFRSKSEVFKAVLEHDMKTLNSSTLERIDGADGVRAKIFAFILARMENAVAHADFFRIIDSEQGGLSLTWRQYRDWLREPVLRLAEALEEGVRRGEIRRLPAEKVAWTIAHMTRGAIHRQLLGQDGAPPCEDAEFLLDFVWRALSAGSRQS